MTGMPSSQTQAVPSSEIHRVKRNAPAAAAMSARACTGDQKHAEAELGHGLQGCGDARVRCRH